MKTILKLSTLLLAIFTISTFSAKAQETDGGKWRLSVGPEASLPIGDLKDGYDWSIGGSIQADYAIYQNSLFVTLNAGYSNFFAKDFSGVSGKDLQLIPVKAGLKYFPVGKFYVQAEAGASFLANKDDYEGVKSTVFTYAPQIGYLFSLGGKSALDLGFKFQGNTKLVEGGSSANYLGLRVAYAFGL